MDAHAVVARVLDRAQLQDARARGGHLEHLLEGDHVELARVRHDARIGAEDARNVGVDFAHLRADGRRERDGGRVRAAAPERGDVAGVGRDALKAGDEHDPILVERGEDAIGAHVNDARAGVRRVGDDPRLRAGQRDRAVAEVVDGHRAQRAGDALAGGQQHVHLARVGRVGDLVGHRDQLVGGLAARREHRHDARAGVALVDDPPRGALDARGVGDGGAAELHHDDVGQSEARRWRRRPAAVSTAHAPFADTCMTGRPAGACARRNYRDRRPAKALPSVTSSAYSRSEPTGRPLARRVTVSSGAR